MATAKQKATEQTEKQWRKVEVDEGQIQEQLMIEVATPLSCSSFRKYTRPAARVV
jgi:hypothetical protein